MNGEETAIDLGSETLQFAKRFEICDNVLIGSTLALIRIPDSTGVTMNISKNVFVQSRKGALITEFAHTRGEGLIWHMMKDAK